MIILTLWRNNFCSMSKNGNRYLVALKVFIHLIHKNILKVCLVSNSQYQMISPVLLALILFVSLDPWSGCSKVG